MSANIARQHLANLHAYAGLQVGLEPGEGGTRNPEIRHVLNAIGDFLIHSSVEEMNVRGPQLVSLLLKIDHPRLKPRRARDAIGSAFIRMGKTVDIWRFGVPYGWLLEHFEPPILALPGDLPAHARVGVGHHAGSVAVEEVTFLDDTFVLLAQTRRAYDQMLATAERTNEPRSAREAQQTHESLTLLNMNVGTFARLTVVTIAAFVESFVNSVGANENARRPTLPSNVAEQLSGGRKGRYLSLEFKMERFPALIRKDGASPLRVTDEKQRQEPFRRFLAETKEVRDAAMHFSPLKMPIICTPQEWLRRANNAAADGVEVARTFWAACYPCAQPPAYLYDLNHNTFVDRAEKRIMAGDENCEPSPPVSAT
jgi:hypothetical protein